MDEADGCPPPGARFLQIAPEPPGWQRGDPCPQYDYVSINELISQNNLRLVERDARTHAAGETPLVPIDIDIEQAVADARHAFYVAEHVRSVFKDATSPQRVGSKASPTFAQRRVEQGARGRAAFFAARGKMVDYSECVRDEGLQIDAVEWLKSLNKALPPPPTYANTPAMPGEFEKFPCFPASTTPTTAVPPSLEAERSPSKHKRNHGNAVTQASSSPHRGLPRSQSDGLGNVAMMPDSTVQKWHANAEYPTEPAIMMGLPKSTSVPTMMPMTPMNERQRARLEEYRLAHPKSERKNERKSRGEKIPNHVLLARNRDAGYMSPVKSEFGGSAYSSQAASTRSRSVHSSPKKEKKSSKTTSNGEANDNHRTSSSEMPPPPKPTKSRSGHRPTKSVDQQAPPRMKMPRTTSESAGINEHLDQASFHERALNDMPNGQSRTSADQARKSTEKDREKSDDAIFKKPNRLNKPQKVDITIKEKDEPNVVKSAGFAERSKTASDLRASSASPTKSSFSDGKQRDSFDEKKPFLKSMWDNMKIKVHKSKTSGDMAGLLPLWSRTPSPSMTPSNFMISCDTEFQADLYSQLDFLITEVANRFLMEEYNSTRIFVSTAAKYVERWVGMGRAQFTEFNCGQPFQSLIIWDQRDNLMFFGTYDQRIRDAALSVWQVNANCMALGTHCHGDSSMQKHLHDTWKILELMGGTWNDFEELSKLHISFHDMVKRAKIMNDNLGIPHDWNPPPVPKTPKEPMMRTPMLKPTILDSPLFFSKTTWDAIGVETTRRYAAERS